MTDPKSRILEALSETQRSIEQLYQLEPGPDVKAFVQLDTAHRHETVLVRQQNADDLELAILLPAGLQLDTPDFCDDHLQVIEGVSHFVLLTERARTELPATRLELEIQAEVDKFALLTSAAQPTDTRELRHLHQWLFERVTFFHEPDTEEGQRYRTANDVAARLCSRLLDFSADNGTGVEEAPSHARSTSLLRRFYRSGQAEKIRLALAA